MPNIKGNVSTLFVQPEINYPVNSQRERGVIVFERGWYAWGVGVYVGGGWRMYVINISGRGGIPCE